MPKKRRGRGQKKSKGTTFRLVHDPTSNCNIFQADNGEVFKSAAFDEHSGDAPQRNVVASRGTNWLSNEMSSIFGAPPSTSQSEGGRSSGGSGGPPQGFAGPDQDMIRRMMESLGIGSGGKKKKKGAIEWESFDNMYDYRKHMKATSSGDRLRNDTLRLRHNPKALRAYIRQHVADEEDMRNLPPEVLAVLKNGTLPAMSDEMDAKTFLSANEKADMLDEEAFPVLGKDRSLQEEDAKQAGGFSTAPTSTTTTTSTDMSSNNTESKHSTTTGDSTSTEVQPESRTGLMAEFLRTVKNGDVDDLELLQDDFVAVANQPGDEEEGYADYYNEYYDDWQDSKSSDRTAGGVEDDGSSNNTQAPQTRQDYLTKAKAQGMKVEPEGKTTGPAVGSDGLVDAASLRLEDILDDDVYADYADEGAGPGLGGGDQDDEADEIERLMNSMEFVDPSQERTEDDPTGGPATTQDTTRNHGEQRTLDKEFDALMESYAPAKIGALDESAHRIQGPLSYAQVDFDRVVPQGPSPEQVTVDKPAGVKMPAFDDCYDEEAGGYYDDDEELSTSGGGGTGLPKAERRVRFNVASDVKMVEITSADAMAEFANRRANTLKELDGVARDERLKQQLRESMARMDRPDVKPSKGIRTKPMEPSRRGRRYNKKHGSEVIDYSRMEVSADALQEHRDGARNSQYWDTGTQLDAQLEKEMVARRRRRARFDCETILSQIPMEERTRYNPTVLTRASMAMGTVMTIPLTSLTKDQVVSTTGAGQESGASASGLSQGQDDPSVPSIPTEVEFGSGDAPQIQLTAQGIPIESLRDRRQQFQPLVGGQDDEEDDELVYEEYPPELMPDTATPANTKTTSQGDNVSQNPSSSEAKVAPPSEEVLRAARDQYDRILEEGANLGQARRRNETAQEKRARKLAVKAARRQRRQAKKLMKAEFTKLATEQGKVSTLNKINNPSAVKL